MREGAVGEWLLPDGRELVVYPMLYGKGRLVVSATPDASVYDDGW